jgi:thiol-disulfide isomerase/thioredoxin
MKFLGRQKLPLITFVLTAGLLSLSFLSLAQSRPDKTLEEIYPGLSTGALQWAVPAKMPRGTLLISGKLTIKEVDILKEIKRSDATVRPQLTKNAFYLLENMAVQGLLLQEAHKAGYKERDPDKAVTKLLSEKVTVGPISEQELKEFHSQNKEMILGAPLEQVRDNLEFFLTQQKLQEAIRVYIQTLGKRRPIQVNEEWVKKQSLLTMDNPVDLARQSGKPSLIDFGATGCGPCDRMTPILTDLEKKYKDKLNVVFVHVNKEEILTARFGINNIPVQVFFDQKGREVFRHTGFFSQPEIEKKLAQMGLTNR